MKADPWPAVITVCLVAYLVSPRDGLGLGAAPDYPSLTQHMEPLLAGQRTPINRASLAALELLPGVNQSMALSIDEYRVTHGDFCSPGALTYIRGIGPARLAALESFISLEHDSPSTGGINRMDRGGLLGIRGVGPVLAKRILERRAAVGGFSCYDQLDSIRGVGSSLANRLWAIP